MSNGFSGPDPATVDEDEGEEIDDPEEHLSLIPENGAFLDLVDDKVNCRNCTHYPTCALISGFRGMVENWQAGGPDDEAPIDAEDFAVICEEFTPNDEVLEEAEVE